VEADLVLFFWFGDANADDTLTLSYTRTYTYAKSERWTEGDRGRGAN
jgi:hypothetical protein